MRDPLHSQAPTAPAPRVIALLVVASVLSWAGGARGQSPPDAVQPAGNVMAALVYKFTGYIRWPLGAASGPFRIAVLGETPLAGTLAEIALRKKVATRPIEIRTIADPASLERCHVLVLSGADDALLRRALEHLRGQPTLVITHHEGAAQRGAGINFVTREGRIRFEVNLAALQAAALVPNSMFLKLAIIIEADPAGEKP